MFSIIANVKVNQHLIDNFGNIFTLLNAIRHYPLNADNTFAFIDMVHFDMFLIVFNYGNEGRIYLNLYRKGKK